MMPTLYEPFRHWSEGGSVYILSDLHFGDEDCKFMSPDWISPQEQIFIINGVVMKSDTFICLGDVGRPEYIKEIKARKKILILGNHDAKGAYNSYFDEIYTGPLFIAEKILLSHEPVYGLPWCLNIHGHDHSNMEPYKEGCKHINLAANVCGYTPINLGKIIKEGVLADVPSIHRMTIDNLRLRAINCYLECMDKEKWKLPFVRVQQKTFLENVISEADYEYFKSCLKKDDEMFWYFVIRFLAATGARVSELIQIKAEHVKLGHLDLYSKGGKLRRIYIPKELQNEAISWLAEKQQESGFIFLNKYGERITTRGISGQLKKLAVKYGINPAVVYPHSFRHRFAKSFLERCNDIAFLADLMGHESIETTRIYLRKTATEQREIIDTIVDW